MPHSGGWRDAGVVAEAFRFNFPLRQLGNAPAESFASVDDPNLVIDSIKRAEDSDAVILRLYECHGAQGNARLNLAGRFSTATLCNILEEPNGPSQPLIAGQPLHISYGPYQIISLKIE